MSEEMMVDQAKFDETANVLQEAVLAGDMEAAVHLGNLYYGGLDGKAKNTEAALPYWQRAVDNGNLSVANKVAYCYMWGDGCEKNQAEGFRYFQLNADHGNVDAQFEVGQCYEEGIGCEKNIALAKKYYEKAALKGHGQAQSYYAMLLYAEKHDDWLHWICCAHISGVKEATDYLHYMIEKDFPKDLIEWQIGRIKEYGVDPRKHPKETPSSNSGSQSSGGCYIATCAYGSYDCPQVWTLRRYRDEYLASSYLGRFFIKLYYATSPTVVKYWGKINWMRKMWRTLLDAFVQNLQYRGFSSDPYQDRDWNSK